MSRSDQYTITLTRERDQKDFGEWQTFSGGDLQAQGESVGGDLGLPVQQLGGPTTREPIKCSRVFYPETDGGELEELEESCGRDFFLANRQKLDIDSHTVGAPQLFTCMLMGVKLGDVDVSSSEPTADVYTIELAPNTSSSRKAS